MENQFEFENFSVYVRAEEFYAIVLKIIANPHIDKMIKDQLKRAALSIVLNIAEGAGRESNADYLRFLSIARGSLAEAEYFLHLAKRLAYLGESDWKELTKLVNYTFAALAGLMKSI